MDFRVLAVGDVVGNPGLEQIRRNLRQMKRQYHADFAVVNGENAAVVGITPNQADSILDAGADIVTMGNHTFGRREICPYLDDCPRILRPANLAPQLPGRGWGVFDSPMGEVAVIDLIGRCNMDYNPDNPFLLVDKILKRVTAKFILVEIHAEATSEKLAMGHMLDGQVSAVWGTHTHVPTADNQILPKSTGFVTDLGMTGPKNSILGIRPDLSVARFRGNLTGRYQPAPGPGKLEGVVFTLDERGRCTNTQRVTVYD